LIEDKNGSPYIVKEEKKPQKLSLEGNNIILRSKIALNQAHVHLTEEEEVNNELDSV
jgi:hypothetical protein